MQNWTILLCCSLQCWKDSYLIREPQNDQKQVWASEHRQFYCLLGGLTFHQMEFRRVKVMGMGMQLRAKLRLDSNKGWCCKRWLYHRATAAAVGMCETRFVSMYIVQDQAFWWVLRLFILCAYMDSYVDNVNICQLLQASKTVRKHFWKMCVCSTQFS